jgi:glycosyltransferase involved in cell wall biosynthesis
LNSLHIIDHFSLGGAQRIVEGILDAIHGARLLPLRKKGSDAMQFSLPDDLYFLKPSRNPLRQLLNLLRTPALILKQRVPVLHFHLYASWVYGLLLRLLLGRHCPRLVFHEHDSIHLTRWYYPALVRLISRYGIIIAVSAFIQERIAACGVPANKIHLLRNFVDLRRFSPMDQPVSPEIQPNRSRIGFAGRLVEYKGWRVVLEMAKIMPETTFLIAGTGTDANKIASEINQNGLQKRVQLLGYIKNMETFFHQIDLLVIPSVREAFGLVQLEAQACGVPVLVFASEAAQEIHGDGSTVLVPSGDIPMLAANARALLADPALYQKMVEKGLANAHLYQLGTYAEQLNSIYQSVLNT